MSIELLNTNTNTKTTIRPLMYTNETIYDESPLTSLDFSLIEDLAPIMRKYGLRGCDLRNFIVCADGEFDGELEGLNETEAEKFSNTELVRVCWFEVNGSERIYRRRFELRPIA